MAKVRSPNYPTLSLGEAVKRIQLVYDKEHRHPADKLVIAKDLGYGTLNGASMGIISALLKYGFLEPVGDQARVSSRGEDVCLYGTREPQRVAALREAAFRPVLFSELHDLYGERLPSDNSLRASLVKKGFNPNTVAGVIRSYRDTIEFLNAEDGDSDAESEEELRGDDSMQEERQYETTKHSGKDDGADFREFFNRLFAAMGQGTPLASQDQSQTPGQVQPPPAQTEHPYSWPLPPGVTANITFRGREPTSGHVAQLIGYLEHFRTALEAEEQAVQPTMARTSLTTQEAPAAQQESEQVA